MTISPAFQTANQAYPPPPPGSPYSIALPNSEQKGRSAVYRHWRFRDGLLRSLDPEVTTVQQLFEDSAKRYGSRKCLGYRSYNAESKTWGPYEWLDYATVHQRRANLGVGLVEVNRQAGITGTKYGVGLWCQNRPEWQITDLACMSQSLFTVSLYETLGPDATLYIINHAELPCIATSLAHIPTLLKLKPRLPSLKVIVSLDPLTNNDHPSLTKKALLDELATDCGVKLYSIDEVEAIGASFGTPVYRPPSPSDIATINYTSGTTGNPKGVVLTHEACIGGASCSFLTILPKATDVFISYLPLAHIYERLTEHAALWSGIATGYFHGNILELVDDIKTLRPTGFVSVPRLLNRFGGAIRAATTAQPGFKGALSRHIVDTKLAKLKDPESPSATNSHAIYDRIWGRKVASALGLDRCRIVVSGSAPLDPAQQNFLRVVLGNRILQGYGLTETYAIALAQLPGDLSTGNCGAVAPGCETCLMDVPDMDYLSTDKPQPRGELLVRGHMLFTEYYKNPAETSKAILPGGWFRTGDIATVDSRGRFAIIDRVKNVLKLAQGEYISPERIENVYLGQLGYLAQAYVHGDSSQTFLVGLFGIMPDLFAPFASKVLGQEIKSTDMQAIAAACQDARVRKAVCNDLDRVGRKSKFMGYERVRNVGLMLDPFTVDNELLTPTLKLKRPQTAKRYRKELDDLYAEALAEEEKAETSKRTRARL